VAVPLQQASYEFFPGWQPLTDLQIDLLFQNASLDMNSRATQLGKASSDSVHAWIPDLYPGAHLYVDAKVEGEGKAISDYLQDSPLGGSVGQALREVEIRGPMKGTVKLDIPLDGESEVKASGDASCSATTRCGSPAWICRWSRCRGGSSMTTSRPAFSNLKASLWNQPLTLDYQGRQQPNRYQVDLKFQGQWDSRRQRQDIPALEILQGAATGPAAWG
jgi:uncharacterized protein YhdP